MANQKNFESRYTGTQVESGLVHFVDGAGSSGSWTGVLTGLGSYYDGLKINYRIAFAGGSSSTTLNINGLGAKTIYSEYSSASQTLLTTQLSVGSMIELVYVSSIDAFLVLRSLTQSTNYVDIDSAQVIKGTKTFNGVQKFTGESRFSNSSYCPDSSITDIASGIGKSSLFARSATMQTITGQIMAPNENVSIGNYGYETEKGKIKLQYISTYTPEQVIGTDIAVFGKDDIKFTSFNRPTWSVPGETATQLALTSDLSRKLDKSGGTINAGGTKTPLILKGGAPNYREGLRIIPTDGWSTIVLGGNDIGESQGTSANSWSILNYNGSFYISKNGADGATVKLSNTDGTWKVNNNTIIHSGNIGSQSVSYATTAGTANSVALKASSGGATKATMQYNTTEDCIEFIFS